MELAGELEPAVAIGDRWAASVSPRPDQYSKPPGTSLRLYDTSGGTPTLVSKLDGIVGRDVLLTGDLCAVLDDSVLRLFSIADPKNVRRVADIPLGPRVPAAAVLQNFAPVRVATLLRFQSLDSGMRLVDDHIVAFCCGTQLGERSQDGGPSRMTEVVQVHRINLAPFRGPKAAAR